jgi:hypothetical protein
VGEVPLGSLLRELAADLSTLVRQELELARAETKQEVVKAGKAGGMFGVAGVAGWLAAMFATLAAMFALGAVMPLGWAALVVAVLWGVVAAVLFATGRSRMRTVDMVPDKTVETVKEDVRWLQNRKS